MKDFKTIPTKLLWVDLEMTGLNPIEDVILEISLIVTDFEFKQLDTYEAVIHQPKTKLSNMNEWALMQHTKSGLLEKVKKGKEEKQVENEVEQIIKNNFKDEPAILAGNSIHCDRGFIKYYWPKVEKLLHYRMLDVSSFKVLMQGKYDVEIKKKELHRAQDDIHESINELKHYIKYLKND